MADWRRIPFLAGLAAGRLGLGERPQLDADDLLRRAEQLTGCNHWGEPAPREALERLVEDLNATASLHLPGRIAARFDLQRMLNHRLLIEDALMRHPQWTAAAIERPLFVVGMPRTGTTALHGLLAVDPANRAPATWEVLYPLPLRTDTDVDRRRRWHRANRELPWMEAMSPGFQRGHAVAADEPQECISITAHSLQSYQFQSMYRVPNYQQWLESAPASPAFRYHQRFLQYLQRDDADQDRRRHWVLKAPAHLFDLDTLLEVYPDAAVIQTHRDPREMISSVAMLTLKLRQAFSDDVDPVAVGREMLDRWHRALSRALTVREKLNGGGRILDLRYRDFLADPLTAVRRIYRHFDIEFPAAAQRAIEERLRRHPQHRFGVHRHRLEDFELDPAEVDERFAQYRQRYLED